MYSLQSSNGHWSNDPIHRMVNTMLTEHRDMLPEDSIVVKMKLSIPSPEEYSGSPDLEVFDRRNTAMVEIEWPLR